MSDDSVWSDEWEPGDAWSGGGGHSKRLPRGDVLGGRSPECYSRSTSFRVVHVRVWPPIHLPERRVEVPVAHGCRKQHAHGEKRDGDSGHGDERASEEDAERDRRPRARSHCTEDAATQLARHDLGLNGEEKRVDRPCSEARHGQCRDGHRQ